MGTYEWKEGLMIVALGLNLRSVSHNIQGSGFRNLPFGFPEP